MPSSLFQNQNLSPNPQLNSNFSNILNLYNMVRNSNNPTLMLQSLAQSNPQVKGVMDLVQQYGGDPRTAFYELAKQKGIDPNQILGMLK